VSYTFDDRNDLVAVKLHNDLTWRFVRSPDDTNVVQTMEANGVALETRTAAADYGYQPRRLLHLDAVAESLGLPANWQEHVVSFWNADGNVIRVEHALTRQLLMYYVPFGPDAVAYQVYNDVEVSAAVWGQRRIDVSPLFIEVDLTDYVHSDEPSDGFYPERLIVTRDYKVEVSVSSAPANAFETAWAQPRPATRQFARGYKILEPPTFQPLGGSSGSTDKTTKRIGRTNMEQCSWDRSCSSVSCETCGNSQTCTYHKECYRSESEGYYSGQPNRSDPDPGGGGGGTGTPNNKYPENLKGIKDARTKEVANNAVKDAKSKLATTECQKLLDDYTRRDGKTLRQYLDQITGAKGGQHYSPSTWLSVHVMFRTGDGEQQCRGNDVPAFVPYPGNKAIYLCDQKFKDANARDRTVTVLHEMLHTLGLGEAGTSVPGPTGTSINQKVKERCGY
jgi:hypothetical protein